ncbi:hypothetical protein MKX01_029160, partial [Papaver californicum]
MIKKWALEPIHVVTLPPEPEITAEEFEKEMNLMMVDPNETMVDVDIVNKYVH